MFQVRVTVDTSGAMLKLRQAEKDAEFAKIVALTKTGQRVKEAETNEIRQAFDRPTPFAQNSIYLRPATKELPVAKVWVKDDAGKGTPAVKFLQAEVYGGQRELKRLERMMQARGILPPNMFVVPGDAAQLDAYGNISRGQIQQIISQLRLQRFSGYESRLDKRHKGKVARAEKRAGGLYFVGRPGGGRLPTGVYLRRNFAMGSSIKPVLIFVRRPSYQQRFRFEDVARDTVARHWPIEWGQAKARYVRARHGKATR